MITQASSQTTIRQRKKDRVMELLEEDSLDKAEQEELLSEFSRLHRQDEVYWSVLWGVFGVFLTFVYAMFATTELYYPYAAFSHIQLHGILSSGTIVVAEYISSAAVFSVAISMLLGMPAGLPKTLRKPPAPHNRRLCDQLYGCGVAVCVAASLFWSIVVVVWLGRHVGNTLQVWRLLWLPVCPAFYALLTRHIIRGLEDTSAEIAKLRGSMYEHHKA